MLVHHLPLIEAIIAVLMGGKGGGGAPPPPPPSAADLNPFEEYGVSEAERKAGSKRKGSASSLVIPKPKKGVGPYAG
jgi:hypothetical protein